MVVSGGLFGGEALKDDNTGPLKSSKSKVNAIFDYDDSDDEARQSKQIKE